MKIDIDEDIRKITAEMGDKFYKENNLNNYLKHLLKMDII